MALYLQVTSMVLGLSILAMVNTLTQDNMEFIDICIGPLYNSIKNVGQGAVLEVGANTIPTWNPCVMRVDTCPHCKIVIEPYGKDFNLLGCNKNYDNTGKSCPVGCQYLYIFDQFYKNQTMGFYKDSSTTSWNLAFRSESSVAFVGFCHGNIPLNRTIQLRYTVQDKEEHYGGSSEMSTSSEISSPFFPDLYSLNSEVYTYLIESTNEKDHVYLIFTDWDISPTSQVFVEWGLSDTLYRYNNDRPVIKARSHKVRIVFDTGYEYQHGVLKSNMGFRIKYTYINSDTEYPPLPSTNCGEYSFSSGGKLALDSSSTINYRFYDCVWVVRTSPGFTHTLLSLLKFSIGSGFNSDDYMEIYGGLSSKGRFLTRVRRGDDITTWQYKDTDGFYIHLFGKFGQQDKVQLSFASLNMEKMCSGSNNLWRCNNGYCISATYKCDGIDHCGDNSDEQYGCSGTGSPWQKSSQQTLAFSVVIPVVISVFLIIILFVLFLLVRRYRRAQREVIRRASEGLPSISEDLSHPSGRRRLRRHRGVIGEDLPPAYEEAIRSPPMYPDISLDPPGPGHWMLPKPPPYSEYVGAPLGPAMPPCFEGVEAVSTECPLASNSSSDSSESEQWDGPHNHQLTDDSSDASPIPRVRTTHSYSTSYSSESSFENPNSPRHVRYPVTETETTDPRGRDGRSPPRQEGNVPTELPIRQLLMPDTEVRETDGHHKDQQMQGQANPYHYGQPRDRRPEPHEQDPSARRWRGRHQTQPTERRTDRVHRNKRTDRHQRNMPTENPADCHFQDQPRDRQTDRRDNVRRNLFKSCESSSHKTQNKLQTKPTHDDHDKHKLSPAKVGTNPIDDGHKAKMSDLRKQTRTQREEVMNETRAPHGRHRPRGGPSHYHTSMPNIADPPALSRLEFQSLTNCSSAGVIQEAADMSGSIQPKHRQYAKSLENISQVAGSQALRPFLFDSDLDRSGERDSRWSPREPVTRPSRVCEEGSREALCGDSNTRVRSGELNSSSGCVNAAFCESPTREIPPILISGQGNANLPRSTTDMHVSVTSGTSGSRSQVRQQPHISLRSELIDNEDNECYA